MFGLFFEDINYGLDGGLNAQMIENRHFEMQRADTEGFGKFSTTFEGLYGWETCEASDCEIRIKSDDPVSTNNPHYLSFDAKKEGAGFTNKAYDGIYLKKNMKYFGSFCARADSERNLCIAVECGEETYVLAEVKVDSKDWEEYSFEYIAKDDVDMGTFTVYQNEIGETEFDFFSLKPEDAVLGIFRKDLAEMLKELKPDFLRFPGGCVVEGSTLANRYQWKNSVGEVKERPFNWSRWAVHTSWLEPEVGPYHYYGQSLEVGFYEYFLLCEYLGAKAVPVVGVGLSCQYQNIEKVDLDDPLFNEYVQDAIDLIEFANGDITTKWGKLRAEMGHELPFNLEYIGVGNEQWDDENSEFFERYRKFEKAIHKAYPDIKCIGTAGPDVTSDKYEKSWNFIREESKDKPNFVYAVDEHYYVGPDWLIEHNDFYDEYPRDIKVFGGEYACHIEGANGRFNREDANIFEAALAESAFMTGLERNSDVVVMASYAPLLSRIGYSQWSPNMIWFDGKSAYATPSYYIQKLFSTNEGEYIKKFKYPQKKGLYVSAVRSDDGGLIIKASNVADEELEINVESLKLSMEQTVEETELKADLKAQNSIDKPDEVAPVVKKKTLKEALRVAPKSFKVIKLA